MATKEELLERAKELEVEGRSSMNKEELEKAVAKAERSSKKEEATTGADSPASDPDEVADDLSPSGQDALEEMGEDSEAAELADLALDASGPLHLESPSRRIMTGAVNEEHAKEQEKALAGMPEDFVGNVSEAGFNSDGTPASSEESAQRRRDDEPAKSDPDKTVGELRATGELKQEDVIDFPPPVGEREGDDPNDDPVNERPADSGFANTQVAGATDRAFRQKSVFYTDGLSGAADSNLERSYDIPEILQSNDPVVREAGDESESEAAQEEKSDEEKKEAEEVKSGERAEEQKEARKEAREEKKSEG